MKIDKRFMKLFGVERLRIAFCHQVPVANPDREQRWRERLAPYYAQLEMPLILTEFTVCR